MKKFLRFISPLVLIALLVSGPALTTLAQGGTGTTVPCSGLSESDCKILTDSTEAMQGIRSFTLPSWALNFEMQAGTANSVKIAANGSGTFVLPDAAMALFSDLPPMAAPTDMGPVIALLQKINPALVEKIITQTGLDLKVENLVLQAPGQNTAGSGELILKDSSLYLRLGSPNGADAWFGDPINLTDQNRADLAKSIDDLITQLQSEETQKQLAQMSELQGAAQELTTLLEKYVTTKRGADTQAMGQTMQVFTTTYDIKGMLADPDLPAVVMKFIKSPAVAALGVKPGDVEGLNDAQIKFALMTVGLLVKDSSFTLEQWIGADDKFLHKYDFNLSVSLDTSLFGESTAPKTVDLKESFSFELDQINTATMSGVTPPATYFSLDKTNQFLAGDPSMIETELQLGQTFSGSFVGEANQQDIFSLNLDPGKTVSIEVKSNDAPYLKVYGPDGFLVGDYDIHATRSQGFTADKGGMYLVVLEASWSMNYDITVRPQ